MSQPENNKTGEGKFPGSEDCDSVCRPCWHVALLGLITGMGGSLIGVGGGIIMVPILTLWGLSQKRAQGTSLIVIVALVPVAITTYAVSGNIDFNFAIPLALGGVIGSVLGSNLALRFSNRVLARLFGFFLILIALRLFYGIVLGLLGLNGEAVQCTSVEFQTSLEYVEAGLLGMLAGLAAGFFGVGGGVVFVPTGRLLAGLTQCLAQGSSLTAMLPTSFVAAINYQKQKEVDWVLAKWMIPGAWLGAIVGSLGADWLGKIRDGNILTALFAVFLLYTGARRLIGTSFRSKCDIEAPENTGKPG